MKSEKGVTLISLIVYMTVMCLVIAMLAVVSDLFYSNTEYIKENSENISEYNKFNMYFIEDVKNNKDILSISNTEIVFNDGTIYTYKASPDNSIYRNKVKICNNISYCCFSELYKNSKKIINVHVVINASKMFETNNEYVLRYW